MLGDTATAAVVAGWLPACPSASRRARPGDGGDQRPPVARRRRRGRGPRAGAAGRPGHARTSPSWRSCSTNRWHRRLAGSTASGKGALAARRRPWSWRRAATCRTGRARTRWSTRPAGCRAASSRLAGDRVDTRHTHGTGCSMSSAMATRLARGRRLGRLAADGQGLAAREPGPCRRARGRVRARPDPPLPCLVGHEWLIMTGPHRADSRENRVRHACRPRDRDQPRRPAPRAPRCSRRRTTRASRSRARTATTPPRATPVSTSCTTASTWTGSAPRAPCAAPPPWTSGSPRRPTASSWTCSTTSRSARSPSTGRRSTATHPGKNLVVPLGSEVPADTRLTLVIEYAGRPHPVPAPSTRSDMPKVGMNVTRDGQLWTMQEPFGAFTWYPANDHPSDKALYDIEIEAPAGWSGIANGTATRLPPNGDRPVTALAPARPRGGVPHHPGRRPLRPPPGDRPARAAAALLRAAGRTSGSG